MTHHAPILQLNRRGLFRIKPGLDRIRAVLKVLGDPQEKIHAVHIAGTNGKGSVAASLEAVLRASGYRTGLYTSPHLADVTERIQIAGRPISRALFAALAEKVFQAETACRRRLTYFEFLTAIAFLAFARRKVGLAVVECGLGGLWDATNVIERPLAAILTSIGIDHAQWLGRTEEAIALQKAGIIKPSVPLVSGVRGPGRPVIAREARERQAPLSQVDRDFGAERLVTFWQSGRQQLRYWNKEGISKTFLFGLVGSHQVDNAALVLRALELLEKLGYHSPSAAVRAGLEQVRWLGRFDLVNRIGACPILFDGAHNPPAMRKLLQTLQESPFRNSPKSFVFSVYKDKDYRTIAAMIQPLAASIYLCSLSGSRALPLNRLRRIFRQSAARITTCASPIAAFRQACQEAPGDGLVIVTGSLALVGRLRKPEVQPAEAVCV